MTTLALCESIVKYSFLSSSTPACNTVQRNTTAKFCIHCNMALSIFNTQYWFYKLHFEVLPSKKKRQNWTLLAVWEMLNLSNLQEKNQTSKPRCINNNLDASLPWIFWEESNCYSGTVFVTSHNFIYNIFTQQAWVATLLFTVSLNGQDKTSFQFKEKKPKLAFGLLLTITKSDKITIRTWESSYKEISDPSVVLFHFKEWLMQADLQSGPALSGCKVSRPPLLSPPRTNLFPRGRRRERASSPPCSGCPAGLWAGGDLLEATPHSEGRDRGVC